MPGWAIIVIRSGGKPKERRVRDKAAGVQLPHVQSVQQEWRTSLCIITLEK